MKFLELTLYATANNRNRVLVNLDNVSYIRENFNEYSKKKYSTIIMNSGRDDVDVEESFDEINEILKTIY